MAWFKTKNSWIRRFARGLALYVVNFVVAIVLAPLLLMGGLAGWIFLVLTITIDGWAMYHIVNNIPGKA